MRLESRRNLIECLAVGTWVTSGVAMAGGLLYGSGIIAGSGLFTFLVSIPIYLTYVHEEGLR